MINFVVSQKGTFAKFSDIKLGDFFMIHDSEVLCLKVPDYRADKESRRNKDKPYNALALMEKDDKAERSYSGFTSHRSFGPDVQVRQIAITLDVKILDTVS